MKCTPLLFLLLMCLPSCAIYKTQFDCKPGRGECTSVSQLESRIIEMDCGPDIFIRSTSKDQPTPLPSPKHKIWVNPTNKSPCNPTNKNFVIWRGK